MADKAVAAPKKKMLIQDEPGEPPQGEQGQEAAPPMVAAEGWVRQVANTSIRLASLAQLWLAIDKAKEGEEREKLQKLLQEARPELAKDLTEEGRVSKPAKAPKRLTKAELAAKATPTFKPAPVPGTQGHVWETDDDSESKEAQWKCTRAACDVKHTGAFASLPKTACAGGAPSATKLAKSTVIAPAPRVAHVDRQGAATYLTPAPASPIPANVEALLTSGKEASFKPFKLTDLHRDPKQPRKVFDEAKLDELAASIASAGVVEPLVVRPDGTLVCGERRQLASIRAIALIEKNDAKLPPAQVKELVAARSLLPCIVRDLSAVDVALIQGIENLHRDGLTDLEEAEHYERLQVEFGMSPKLIAQKLGRDLSTVYARLKLCELIPAGRDLLRKGKIVPAVALLVARIPGEKLQKMALADVSPYHDGEPRHFRDAAETIGKKYTLNLKTAPFDTKDAMLYTAPGSCTGACGGCPFRSGNCRALTPDIENADVCTNPEGYQAKVAAHVAVQKTRAEAKGYKWIAEKDAKELFAYGGQVHFNAPFVSLDTPHPEDYQKRRTWRQLLKSNVPQIHATANPQGEVLLLVDRKEAKSVLAKGDNPVARHETRQESQRADNKEEKHAQVIRDRVAFQLLEKLAERSKSKGLELPVLRAVAEWCWDSSGAGEERDAILARVLGLKDLKKGPAIEKLEAPQLMALVTVLTFEDGFGFNASGFNPDVKMAAKVLGEDLGALEKLERMAEEAERAMEKGDVETLEKLAPKAEALEA